MLRPTRDQLLVEDLPDNLTCEMGIVLLVRNSPLSRKKVLAKGPGVYGDIEVGDVVHVQGGPSGIEIDSKIRLVSEQICMCVEKEE